MMQHVETLRAIVSQRLLPHASGTGRVVALEILVNNTLYDGKSPTRATLDALGNEAAIESLTLVFETVRRS